MAAAPLPPRSLGTPPRFEVIVPGIDGASLTLFEPSGPARVHIFVLEDWLIRVAVLPRGTWVEPRTWTIAPGACDVPEEGRERMDMAGFSSPPFTHSTSACALVIETASLRLSVNLDGFFCAWEQRVAPGAPWHRVFSDRPTQAYDWGWWCDPAAPVRHYIERPPDPDPDDDDGVTTAVLSERFLGVGEVAGELDRAGRRVRLAPADAMGYSARTSDPLYKHIPFYVSSLALPRWRRRRCACSGGSSSSDAGVSDPDPALSQPPPAHGVFYDTAAECEFDFGCARSNYHGLFRGFAAAGGDLDFYVFGGPGVAAVVRRFTWLTGRPALPPAWSLGYSGSGMAYSDAPDALARLTRFLGDARAAGLPVGSFHLSSGYSSGPGGRRYVFTWDARKFPEPAALFDAFAAAGVALVPNLKPCLLVDHPEYAAAAAAGFFVRGGGSDGSSGRGTPPLLSQFWGALGSYVDFTAPGSAAWWRCRISSALLRHVPASAHVGLWCDNNEFEGLLGPGASVAGFGGPRPAAALKPVQTLLMVRASMQALRAAAPGLRPFVVSRSGFAGMQRYAQTWSGDNATSWESLRYCLRMGLGLALSGVSNAGHDIGGFAGPSPSPELLLRWVEAGVFLPRCSVHSWKTPPTEPWMHAQTTPAVAALVRFRTRLAPYIYDLLWAAHTRCDAVLRPTLLEFEADPRTAEPTDDFLLGPALLVAPVTAPGATVREVYLPRGADWHAVDRATCAAVCGGISGGGVVGGGSTVVAAAPLGASPLFARAGSVIALSLPPPVPVALASAPGSAAGRSGASTDAAARGFWVFPVALGDAEGESVEDDGISVPEPDGSDVTFWRIVLRCSADGLDISVHRSGGFGVPPRFVEILLPAAERRPVRVTPTTAAGMVASQASADLSCKVSNDFVTALPSCAPLSVTAVAAGTAGSGLCGRNNRDPEPTSRSLRLDLPQQRRRRDDDGVVSTAVVSDSLVENDDLAPYFPVRRSVILRLQAAAT